ncbi:MAG: pyridoxamine 5'-phosphate oxidase family protein [Deltaproteobacteria bacterium]|nr:pyridoxamine 5'-phosphate oxidase family protein [Deltaproteobacteria bacterium]
MQVFNQHMKQVVNQVRLGFVATVCPDGTPNVSPKGTLCVLDDEHLIFADIRSPGTVANLRANQNIEVNVVDPFSRKGYRFKGLAVVHEQGPVFEEFIAFFAKRKLPDAPRRIKSIVVIGVVSAQPLISPAYDEGAIEEEVVAQWKQYYFGRDPSAV